MRRDSFKNKAAKRYAELSVSQAVEAKFTDYMRINETADDALTKREVKRKYKYRGGLAKNRNLAEQYYLFHLIKNIDTRWRGQSVATIATHLYRNSLEVTAIYEQE